MWREFITNLTADCEFNPPATHSEILTIEVSGAALPEELKELLKESNGINSKYGDGLVWSVERIKSENLEFRTQLDFKELYMPFDCLLFFADAGNGDQFAYAILDGKVRRNDVFKWNHEDDSRTWAASNLKQYLEWSLSGNFD